MSIGQHYCLACHRPASRFDRQIGEWVCEGNPDCGLSRGVTPQQRERQEILRRMQPKLIAFGLPVNDIQEIMTRLALTELPLLRVLEVEGLAEVASRVRALRGAGQPEGKPSTDDEFQLLGGSWERRDSQ